MLRRTIRERKAYLHHKQLSLKEEAIVEKKLRLKNTIDRGLPIPTDLQNEEREMRKTLDLEDSNATNRVTNPQDDEYAFAGLKEPNVVITTSRDPSSRLQQFVKELRLLIPNSQRINRGSYIIKDLIDVCRNNEVTDLLLVHESRGEPDCLVICHLPHGPSAYFALSDVVLRHDLPDKPAPISEVYPHLIFENFSSKLGQRFKSILKFLYPPPRVLGTRCISFINFNDYIQFRHHTWVERKKKQSTNEVEEVKGKTALLKELDSTDSIELLEAGPRFTLRPFRIELGTIDMKDLDCEWSLKPYFNKPKATLS